MSRTSLFVALTVLLATSAQQGFAQTFTCDKTFIGGQGAICIEGSDINDPCTHLECPGGVCVDGEPTNTCNGGTRDGLECDCPNGKCIDDWMESDNWTGNEKPADSDNVCIDPDDYVVIKNSTGKANAIWLKADATNTGKLDIVYGHTFELHNAKTSGSVDSIVDGEIFLEYARLKIINDLKITGSGGVIEGSGSGVSKSRIQGSGKLTLEGDNNSSRSTSIVLTGAWDIEAEFVNNAYVVAEESHHGGSNGELTLKDQPKSGNGYWIAEPTGELRIEETVTGDGTWQIDNGGKIVIDATCTSLTGDVVLSAGIFEVKLNFQTTGNLTLNPGGQITVIQGATALFD